MDGVLIIAKPVGPTSHDVVALVRRLAATRRIGHGGTLDPFAAGVLPLYLGTATRLVEYHLADEKRYRATVCFGAASTTDDLDGELTPAEGPAPTRESVVAGLARFLGPQDQVPPAYSAVQVEGRRAYAMARAGEPAILAPRRVAFHALELEAWDDADPLRPVAVVDVRCSAGTYVRALARDLGVAVGSAAYLGALVRTASGPFVLDGAAPIEAVREAAAADGPEGVRALLQPSDVGLDHLPIQDLTTAEVSDAALGRFIRPAAPARRAIGDPTPGPREPGAPIRLLGPDGRLVGIGERRGARIVPTKMLMGRADG